MFESTCSLPTTSELFCLVLHPTKPLLTVGLASGHVETFALPAPSSPSSSPAAAAPPQTSGLLKKTKTVFINSVWRTKRHHGSCRALAYQADGSRLFSAGADGLVKGFDPETGRVGVKFAVQPPSGAASDLPSALLVLNPTTLVAAMDSAWQQLYNLEAPGAPLEELQPHGDFAADLVALPASATSTSGQPKQWASAGETTVSLSDMRKGVVDESEEQDELMTALCYVEGVRARKTSSATGVLVTGSDGGMVKTWDPANLAKPVHKVRVCEGETIECLVGLPQELGLGDKVACGCGDGIIRVVDLRTRKVVEEMTMSHDALQGEPVVALAVDSYGRLISGGGQIVKVWEELSELQGQGDSEEEDEDEDDDDDGDDDEDEDDEEQDKPKTSGKRVREESDEDEDDDDDDEDEDDDDSDSDSDSDSERSKRLAQKEAAKKRKLGPMGAHGILKFDGLD
ncbi:hypothetical protein TD95_000155 [Thielaviopsis punctulata]|uniref:WD repeat-containing protein JIP5 n=1 Tax=Thielaviopsis punctulata TaxID=72032 RepID=A0A0F4Z7E3_9PEZI|nr:hypothetical protein TD95_000155 [Thielaviopsis punctulata]